MAKGAWRWVLEPNICHDDLTQQFCLFKCRYRWLAFIFVMKLNGIVEFGRIKNSDISVRVLTMRQTMCHHNSFFQVKKKPRILRYRNLKNGGKLIKWKKEYLRSCNRLNRIMENKEKRWRTWCFSQYGTMILWRRNTYSCHVKIQNRIKSNHKCSYVLLIIYVLNQIINTDGA